MHVNYFPIQLPEVPAEGKPAQEECTVKFQDVYHDVFVYVRGSVRGSTILYVRLMVGRIPVNAPGRERLA